MAHQKPSQSRDTIPCSRADLIDRIVADAGYAGETESSFRSFCEILIAYVHHRSHVDVERMKRAFESVDPFRDAENSGATDEQARVLMDELSHLMSRANYQLLSNDEIKAALNKASIIPVETAVDFDQFADFRFYFRTRKPITLSLKRWFRIKEITVETYDRMLVMLNTSETLPEDTVEANAVDRSALRADSVYLSYFKNIPHHDLELLFPNIEISMKLKDRLILGVPAVGAAIPLVLKILPSLGLIVGAIALAIFGFEHGHSVAQDTDKSALYALMTAFLSVSIALG